MDREKVINCLTDIEQIMVCRQEICPREELQYWIELQEGIADALALLKEQPKECKSCGTVFNIAYKAGKESIVRCKDCKYAEVDMCCSHPSEWNNSETRNHNNPNWFCADGERKDNG